MQVTSIALCNFMPYGTVRVEFPARGVVAITGSNGSGKSSLVEGVAWVLWGQTLRGESPIADERKVCSGSVVLSDGMAVTRERKGKGTASLKVRFADGSTLDGTTASHAQEQLEHVIGSFDAWRRTRVFSSQDAAHFSLATDAERKRLLEGILDLDRFDEALKACRSDWSMATRAAEQAQRNYDVQDAKLGEMRRRLDDARRGLETLTDASIVVEAVQQEIAQLDEQAKANDTLYRTLQEKRRVAAKSVSDAQAACSSVERELSRLKVLQCPTCGQKVDDGVRAPWVAKANQLRAEANAAREAASGLDARCALEMDDIHAKQQALRARREKLTGDLRVQQQQQSARASFQSTLASIESEIEHSGLLMAALSKSCSDSKVQAAELEACAQVLGLRGVRSQVLAHALPGIEASANAWLARIAWPGVSISLSSTSTLKGGGDVEKIGLNLVGLAGGRGYRAASGGQRRRIDVALLLALADIAGAARARAPETLWLDEIFDSLDDDGTSAVAGLLEELSAYRAVCVITHEPGAWLRPALRLHVDKGAVTEL